MKGLSKILGLIVAVAITASAFGQSATIDKFDAEQKENGNRLFLYQSMIRVLNKDKNPDFNRLIRDLDYIKLILTPSMESGAREGYADLKEGLEGEGYNELMTVDGKDYKYYIVEKEVKGVSNWVSIVFFENRFGLLEMNGTLDPKYFSAFNSLDESALTSIMRDAGIDVPQE